MKYLLVLLIFLYIGCTEITTTPSSVTVEVANPNTQQAAAVPGIPPVVLPDGFTLTEPLRLLALREYWKRLVLKWK